MKRIVWLLGGALLLLVAGCEVESGYGGGYGVYGEYPYTYNGGYAEPYPYYGYYPHLHGYDRDHYWDRHHYWDRGRYWDGRGRYRRDHDRR